MAAHLWEAALDKALDRNRRTGCDRGDLGLNMQDWCHVLQAACNARRTAHRMFAWGVLAGCAAAAAARVLH